LRSIAAKAVVAGLLALIFMSQGMTAPFEKDEEARPAGIVLDVVEHGHWLIPADLYGEPTRKPPFYYWMAAAVAEARGGVVDEPGVRTTSLLAASVTAGLVIAFTCTYADSAAGGIALLFLLGMYGFASRGAHMRTDMLFSCLVFAAWCLIFPLIEGDVSAGRTIAAGVILGMAALTKGPLAIAMLAVALGIYALLERINPTRWITQPWPWLVLAIAIAMGAAWYVPAFIRDPQLFRVQFLQENLGHFVPARLGGTGEAARPFYYLWLRFIGAALPLILYLPAALLALFPARGAGRAMRYQLALMLAVLAIFTVATSKRDIYVLPALPPLAIVLSAPFARDREKAPFASTLITLATGAAGVGLLMLAVLGILLAAQPGWAARLAAQMQSSDAAYLDLIIAGFAGGRMRFVARIVVAAAGALAALLMLKRRSYGAAVAIGIASLAAVSLWIGVLRPELAARRTLAGFAKRAEPIVRGRPLHVVGAPEYELSWHLRRGIPGWRRWMLRPNAACASYLIVWSNQLGKVAPGGKIMGWEMLLDSDPQPGRGHLLLLNVGAAESDQSRPCLER
jgi:4-amino-4-deoxy-L-arabinose transferase-like glycosyltransferase